MDTNRLISLLTHQRTLFRQLRRLAERQRLLVLQDEPEPLIHLLAERQRLVDALGSLNSQLSEFRQNWTSVYSGLTETERHHVAELLEEVNSSLGMILQSDTNDTAALSAKRESIGSQMSSFETGGRVAAAYGRTMPSLHSQLTDAKV